MTERDHETTTKEELLETLNRSSNFAPSSAAPGESVEGAKSTSFVPGDRLRIVHGARARQRTTIVGQSPRIKLALEMARKAAATTSTVLLLGESGTGKENFARAIHEWSVRKNRPFVAINCVGLSQELLESELFGHEKGAFTGAHQAKQGKIEPASGGTLFLDEIGDIAPSIQAKLLRFIEERRFERVGGNNTLDIDVRIIAATNRNLERAVDDGTFRLDLYFRLNVIPILLPPLRERKSDIPALTQHFLERHRWEGDIKSLTVSEAALDKLQSHSWPGNVRELANVIERAAILSEGSTIDGDEIVLSTRAADPPEEPLESLPYREAVLAFKRRMIKKVLEQEGSQTAAARALRLQKTYLSRLIKELQLK